MTAPAARASALNRFGLGARPGDMDRADDPRTWLLGQLRAFPVAAFAGFPDSLAYLQEEGELLQARRAQRRAERVDAPAPASMQAATPAAEPRTRAPGLGRLRAHVIAELDARYQHAATTPDGFAERLVRFWSNHFAVSADKRQAAPYAVPMEREAIRPHAFGPFAELLLAVEQHPAMLRYLDNVRSVGADSMLANRAAFAKRKLGLNENLAREILELHTLGVDGGYVQADVTELARAITGWSTPVYRDFDHGSARSAFVFRPAAHEAGPRSVLGRRYADAGVSQGEAILRDLAMHPATARHVCRKLAAHFVQDAPPEALVQRMSHAWLGSGGDLSLVYRSLVEGPEAWASSSRKFKSPDDLLVSALRASNTTLRIQSLQPLLVLLGQPPFTPRSPAGFPDTAAAWAGADAMFKRIQTAQRLSELAPEAQIEPIAVARSALGATLDAETATAIRRAESPRGGLAVLFASPAFQWRT